MKSQFLHKLNEKSHFTPWKKSIFPQGKGNFFPWGMGKNIFPNSPFFPMGWENWGEALMLSICLIYCCKIQGLNIRIVKA